MLLYLAASVFSVFCLVVCFCLRFTLLYLAASVFCFCLRLMLLYLATSVFCFRFLFRRLFLFTFYFTLSSCFRFLFTFYVTLSNCFGYFSVFVCCYCFFSEFMISASIFCFDFYYIFISVFYFR